MAAAKNGAARIAGAFRQAIQALPVPELRQHGERRREMHEMRSLLARIFASARGTRAANPNEVNEW